LQFSPGSKKMRHMSLVNFPYLQIVMRGATYGPETLAEIDGMLAEGSCDNGWLEIETAETRLVCLFHQAKTHLAGMVDEDGFSDLSLAELPARARQLEGAVCNLVAADPVLVLLVAVHLRNRPAVVASTDLLDPGHVLQVLAERGTDAALALERDGERTLLFLQKGQPARVYFPEGVNDPGEGSVADRFLLHAFAPECPVSRIEVFQRLNIEPDPNAGKSLRQLEIDATPPPPRNMLVQLASRTVLQQGFLPPTVVIGRDFRCGLILNNLSVSRRHAKLCWEGGKFFVEDLGSANGTTINGEKIQRQALAPGDRIGVGKFEIQLAEPPEISQPDATMLMMPAAGQSVLSLVGEGRHMPLGPELTIGRARGVDLRLKGWRIKGLHARIKSEAHGIHRLICQTGASILLNGRKTSATFVHAGDKLQVGKYKFHFEDSKKNI